MGDIKHDFKVLVEQYVVDLAAAKPSEQDQLLSDLVDKLHDEAADYWYSSSADC